MGRAAHIRFDWQALSNNLSVVKTYAPHSKILAMVKANAYGHGLGIVAEQLTEQVDGFGVACIEEALRLRDQGIVNPIFLMEGFFHHQELPLVERHNLTLVIHNHQQVEHLASYNFKSPVEVWVKLDTGMNRLGFDAHQAPILLEKINKIKTLQLSGVMTHFGDAFQTHKDTTLMQLKRFEEVVNAYSMAKSLANSAAIVAWPNTHYDWVRPGIMLYGISPIDGVPASKLGLKPVMSFYSEVISTKPCAKGEKVGYGGTWQASSDTQLAVIACGYGDGYPRHAKNGTPVLIQGIEAPLVGRVSMDMLCVDVGHIPDVCIGDEVELWGPNLPIERIAEASDTIGYELVCQITDRVRPQDVGPRTC